jgi:hypothetical protein
MDDSGAKPWYGSIIAGNMVYISARYLNINGLVQSGISDRSLTLDASYQAFINYYQNHLHHAEKRRQESFTALQID